MPIIERLEDPGQFTVSLDASSAPPTLLTSIDVFDHIVIMPNRVLDPDLHADADLKGRARYAGVVLEKEYDRAAEIYTIRGQGMSWWLGDSQGNGPILFQNLSYDAETVDNILDLGDNGGILPPAVTPGTITTTDVGSFTGDFEEADRPIDALRTVAAALNLSWRVNPNGTLDACLRTRDDVFRTTADAIKYAIVRDNWGFDSEIRSVEAERFTTRFDGRNYATRAILIGEQFDGARQIDDYKDRASIPYKDIHGNEMVWNVPVTIPQTDPNIDIDTWFDRQLEDWNLDLETEVDALEEQFANGQAMVGDHFLVYDPPSIRDEENGIWHRGRFVPFRIIQAKEAEWYLRTGMDVLCRHKDASWSSLSKFVRWER